MKTFPADGWSATMCRTASMIAAGLSPSGGGSTVYRSAGSDLGIAFLQKHADGNDRMLLLVRGIFGR